MAFKTAMNVSKLMSACPQFGKHSIKCLQPGRLNVIGICRETRTLVFGWSGTHQANKTKQTHKLIFSMQLIHDV